METCETWESPHSIAGLRGSTPQNACAAVAKYFSEFEPGVVYSGAINGSYCHLTNNADGIEIGSYLVENHCTPIVSTTPGNTINCDAACTVAVELKAAEPDAEKITDMAQIWGLFLVVLVAVYCAKQILKFFESTPHGE
nr:hypothetical protein [uncultured Albidiferax sp.]